MPLNLHVPLLVLVVIGVSACSSGTESAPAATVAASPAAVATPETTATATPTATATALVPAEPGGTSRPVARKTTASAPTATRRAIRYTCEPHEPARIVGGQIVNRACGRKDAARAKAHGEYATSGDAQADWMLQHPNG